MVATKPAEWALSAGAVDARFRKFWRDPAFVLSPWHWDRAIDLANRAPASQQPASSVGAFGRGWDCQYLNDDTHVVSWPTSAPNTHLAGPLEWTMFFAYEHVLTPHFNSGYVLRRNAEWVNGGYSVRLSDNDLRMDFHSPTNGQAHNQWFNSFDRVLGYNSFVVTRNADGRVRAYANAVALEVTTERIDPTDLVEPFAGTGNFRLNTRTSVNGRMLTSWVSRGVSVDGRDAAMLHNDPWAIFRPEPRIPVIFGGVDSGAGGSAVRGTAAAGSGPGSVAASGAHGVAGVAAAQTGTALAAAHGTHSVAPEVTGSVAAASGAVAAAATAVHGVSGEAAANTGSAHGDAGGIVVPFGAAAAAAGAAWVAASGTHDEAPAGAATIRAPAIRAQGWGLATPPPDYSDIGDAFILEVGVPYSVNSIINGALDLIASNGIASLSDSSSHVGNAIKRNFDVERDSLLREYPWNFAMRRTKLAASSEAPAFRFRRAYELPAGPKPEFCLRVWAVGNEENRQDSDVWEISGRRLLTDLEAPLPIRYIGRIVNPALWDPLTIKALEARLAWQAAYLASGSAALAEQMARIYQERLDAAKAIDAQEGTPEPFEDGTTWVDSRLTGVSW